MVAPIISSRISFIVMQDSLYSLFFSKNLFGVRNIARIFLTSFHTILFSNYALLTSNDFSCLAEFHHYNVSGDILYTLRCLNTNEIRGLVILKNSVFNQLDSKLCACKSSTWQRILYK